MEETCVRFVAKNKGEGNNASIKTAIVVLFVVRYLSSIIVGIAILVFANYFAAQTYGNPSLIPVLTLMAFSTFIPPLKIVATSLLYAYRKIERWIFVDIFSLISLLAFSLAFVINGFGAIGLATAEIITGVFTTILSLLLAKPILGTILREKNRLEKSKIKEIIGFSFHLAISKISSVFNARFDKIILGLYASIVEVGYYGLARGIASYVGTLPNPLTGAMFPVASEMTGRDEEENIKTMFFYSVKYLTVLSLYILVLALVFSPVLFELIFPSYKESIQLFQILIIATAMGMITSPIVTTITSIGKVKLLAKIRVFGAVVGIILLVLLAPSFGAFGVAVATLSAITIRSLVFVISFVKNAKYSYPSKETLASVLAAILALLSTWVSFRFLGSSIWEVSFSMLVASCSFFAVLFLSGSLSRRDLVHMKLFLQRKI